MWKILIYCSNIWLVFILQHLIKGGNLGRIISTAQCDAPQLQCFLANQRFRLIFQRFIFFQNLHEKAIRLICLLPWLKLCAHMIHKCFDRYSVGSLLCFQLFDCRTVLFDVRSSDGDPGLEFICAWPRLVDLTNVNDCLLLSGRSLKAWISTTHYYWCTDI